MYMDITPASKFVVVSSTQVDRKYQWLLTIKTQPGWISGDPNPGTEINSKQKQDLQHV